MIGALKREFINLPGAMETVALSQARDPFMDRSGKRKTFPLGKALQVTCRPEAPIQILFNGHMDTVYGEKHPFQTCTLIDKNKLQGPGTADMKGGLVVMLKALETFELCPWKNEIGWEVFIGPDEEIGSPGSAPILLQKASSGKFNFGLVYEPTFPDGKLVRNRKGSFNFSILVEGREAHVGRYFKQGKHAIAALCQFVTKVHALNDTFPDAIFNVGYIEGGGAVNVVPDRALAHLNVRVAHAEDVKAIEKTIENLVEETNQQEGILLTCEGQLLKTPKEVDTKTEHLFNAIAGCGKELGMKLDWQDTGGGSDGNNLWAGGLPNIDTMGVQGGDIHSNKEYLLVDSLVQRTQLTTLLLMKLASKELKLEDLLCQQPAK